MDQNSKKYYFDQQLKNRLAYINFNATFEFLGKFKIRCIHSFS